jgi:hypothetical protein
MHSNDQATQSRNQIAKAREGDLRVGDYPTTGAQELGEIYTNWAAVVIRVYHSYNNQKGPGCMELEGDVRLNLPEMVGWLSACIPMGMD